MKELPISNEIELKKSKSMKLEYLEGIRGLAAFLVCLHHYRLMIQDSKWAKEFKKDFPYAKYQWSRIWIDGSFDVALFFILSGRVLTLSVMAKAKKGDPNVFSSIGASIFKRTIRLGIPLLGISLLTSLLVVLNAFSQVPKIRIHDKGWFHAPAQFQSFSEFLYYVIAWFTGMTYDMLEKFGKYICTESSWTLPKELVGSFYLFLLTPVMVSIKSEVLRHLSYFALVLLLRSVSNLNIYFVVGMWIAELSLSGHLQRISQLSKPIYRIGLWVVRIIMLLGVVEFASYQSKWAYWLDHSTISTFTNPSKWYQLYETGGFLVSGTLLILLVEITPLLQSLFGSTIFRFLGKISYCLYLSHGIILMAVVPRLFLYLNGNGMDAMKSFALSLPIFLVLSVIQATILEYLVDRPAVRFSNAFQKWYFNQSPFSSHLTRIQNWFKRKEGYSTVSGTV